MRAAWREEKVNKIAASYVAFLTQLMMKYFRIPHLLSLLVAGLCVAAPASSYADRKVKVYRDLDGDGHYNKKTIRVSDRHRHHGHRSYGYNRGYYGYGRGYGYGYRPYRSYSRPSIGLSFFSSGPAYYSSPSYYTRERYTTYRSAPSAYSYDGSLSAEVQEALKRRGYYRGAIDGDIGPGSRSAIRAYQADRGLAVTGRIDSSLLDALGIG